MEKNIEIEYKTLVNINKFNRFLSDSPITEEIYQINYYYDTTDFQLYHAGATLRIRQIGSRYYFTLKERTRSHSVEHEQEVDDNSLDFLSNPDVIKLLEKFNLTSEINLVGELATLRKIYHDQYGEWCFDHNFYNGIEDFEIEYELHPGVTNAFKHYLFTLRKYNIKYKKAPGKRYRCLFSKRTDS